MPNLTFLRATSGVALTKTISPTKTTSYPLVKHFTSEEVEVSSPADLLRTLRAQAKKGTALLRGPLTEPLVNDSRRGKHDSFAPTAVAVFDLDQVLQYETVEAFIRSELPPAFHDVSYVVQYSASHGLKPGLNCHIFFLLAKLIPPNVQRLWLRSLNLNSPVLREQTVLTNSKGALHFPVDPVVAQNTHLIYVAPPNFVDGAVDPVKTRIALVKKNRELVDFDFLADVEKVEADYRKRLNALRKAEGLPVVKRIATKRIGQEDCVTNTKITVTESKQEGDFLRCNVNGGDSWAYWLWRDHPEVLYSFKDEPPLSLKHADPEFYNQLANDFEGQLEGVTQGTHYFGVIDKISDRYCRVTVDVATMEVSVSTTRVKQNLIDWLMEHDAPVPEFFETWTFVTDPHAPQGIDPDQKTINLWRSSGIIRTAQTLTVSPELPSAVDQLVLHVMGGCRASTDRFHNWFASIVQDLRPTGTAWLLHGTTGTGKNTLIDYVLTPILGDDHVHTTTLNTITATHNGWLEGRLLVHIEDAEARHLAHADAIKARMKPYITGKTVPIRRMQTDEYHVTNLANWIFSSNQVDALPMDANDRRLNIPPRQEEAIDRGFAAQFRKPEFHDTLVQYAHWCLHHKVDRATVATPMQSVDRDEMIELNMNTIELIVKEIQAGNLQWFIDQMPESNNHHKLILELGEDFPHYHEFLREALNHAQEGTPHVVSNKALRMLFWYLAEITHKSPVKFGKMLAHRGLKHTRSASSRGVAVNWKSPTDLTPLLKKELDYDARYECDREDHSGNGLPSRESAGARAPSPRPARRARRAH